MTNAEARDFPWIIAEPLVAFVLVAAVVLLGFAILREITR